MVSISLINVNIFVIIVKEKLQLSGIIPKFASRICQNGEHIAPSVMLNANNVSADWIRLV